LKNRDIISENYRKQVESHLDDLANGIIPDMNSEKDIEETWSEITDGLDIDDVWKNISADLDYIMPVRDYYSYLIKLIAAVIVILSGLISVNKMDESNVNGSAIPEIPGVKVKKEVISVFPGTQPLPAERDSGKPSIKQTLVSSTESEAIKFTQGKGEKTQPEPTSRISFSTNKADTIRLPATNHVYTEYITGILANDSLMEVSQPNLKKGVDNLTIPIKPSLQYSFSTKPDPTGGGSVVSGGGKLFYAGIITNLKNTWLLNSETIDGLKPESLNSSVMVFYLDMGLTFGYELSKKWQLQSDAFLFSPNGQEYHKYLYGHYVTKRIDLRYSSFDFLLKYKVKEIRSVFPGSSIYISAGPYIAYLRNAHQKIDEDATSLYSNYRKTDYGIKIAAEFELNIFNDLYISPGVLFSAGAINIFKGSDFLPASFGTTRTGSLEFHLAFYYKFK
jgi:hypothetical protein